MIDPGTIPAIESPPLRRLTHVVLLNDFLSVQGGASRVAVDEAICIALAGVQVIFVGAVGEACSELNQANIRVVNLDQREILGSGLSPSTIVQNFWNAKAYRAMGDILAELDPGTTIVHLHGYTKALTVSPVSKAAALGFRVVCTLHDFFAACPNGAFFDYVRGIPCERKALSLSCMTARCDKRSQSHKVFRVARGLVQRHVSGFPSNVHDYIALSRRSAEILRPYLPADSRVTMLANVIPGRQRPPVAVADKTTIVAVGRLDREKGIEVLLEAATLAGVAILFVGEGPLRPMIEATPGMRVTGWLSAQGVRECIDDARALVFPSLWYETFGLVVSEAASRGVPSIVSDVSAASERVEHGKTGWIVQSGNTGQLATALREAAGADLAPIRGLAAFEAFWADPPDMAGHGRGLMAIYEGMLARRSNRTGARATNASAEEYAV